MTLSLNFLFAFGALVLYLLGFIAACRTLGRLLSVDGSLLGWPLLALLWATLWRECGWRKPPARMVSIGDADSVTIFLLALDWIVSLGWFLLCIVQAASVAQMEHEATDWPWMGWHCLNGFRIILMQSVARLLSMEPLRA